MAAMVWDATVFCKLLDGDIAAKFFASVLNLPRVRRPLIPQKGAGKEAKLWHIGHLMMENAMA
jgi:hypothetical protein